MIYTFEIDIEVPAPFKQIAPYDAFRKEYESWCKIVGHIWKSEPGYKGTEVWCSTCGKHKKGTPIYSPFEPRILITNITVPEGY